MMFLVSCHFSKMIINYDTIKRIKESRNLRRVKNKLYSTKEFAMKYVDTLKKCWKLICKMYKNYIKRELIKFKFYLFILKVNFLFLLCEFLMNEILLMKLCINNFELVEIFMLRRLYFDFSITLKKITNNTNVYKCIWKKMSTFIYICQLH